MNSIQINIADLKLKVSPLKDDAAWYQMRRAYEENASKLYSLISNDGFKNFCDIGANCGMISMLMRRAAPNINIVSIEADPRLYGLISENFLLNGLTPPKVVHAVVGEENDPNGQLSLNPYNTLDNRVSMPSWRQEKVQKISIDSLIEELNWTDKTFFKIDVQGYEEYVLKGMQDVLFNHKDWMIKMEFAPNWQKSQGTNSIEFLNVLCSNFIVAEFPERVPYNTASLSEFFRTSIDVNQTNDFLSYLISLNREGQGWLDLAVVPKSSSFFD